MPKKPDPGPTCGSCLYWKDHDQQPQCFFFPPKMGHDPDDGSYWLERPIVEASEPACAQFKGRQ